MLTNDELLTTIKQMSVMGLVDLVRTLEIELGVKATLPAAPVVEIVAPEPVAEEQSEFTVRLTAVGDRKIEVIKTVRQVTPLGLREAKELVDSYPAVVVEGVPRADAESINRQLMLAGATVVVS